MAGSKHNMTVLMTADTVGGVWTYCMDLCKSLQHYRVQVHLVTMGEKMKDWQQEEVGALANVVVHETAFKLEWMQDPWEDIAACGQWLLQLEKEVQPDLVHLNCFAYGSLPFNAPLLVVAHSDVWSWFSSVKGEAPGEDWKAYHDCVKAGLDGADFIVAPSRAKLDLVKKMYGVDQGEVIYNGRNASLFSCGKKEPFIFSMGRIWDEAKNIRLLMEAAPLVGAPVKIAGDNSFAQNSIAVSNVDFLGKLPTRRVAAQLSAAAIYVLPAKYEPFGLSALEAALSGCALVLGDVSTLREIWGEAAIYVNTNKAEELAAAINRLVENREELEKWGKKAKRQTENYSLEKMGAGYWQCYRQLVKQTTKQPEQETV